MQIYGKAFAATTGLPFYRMHHSLDGHRSDPDSAWLSESCSGAVENKPRQNQAQHRFHRAAERHLPLLPGSPGTAQSSADPQPAILEPLTYLMGCVYIFCPEHKSLRLKRWVDSHGFRWVQRSPAIAAGLTDHIWTVKELLLFLIPPHE